MASSTAYAGRMRETRNAEAETARESHEPAIRRPTSEWGKIGFTVMGQTTGLSRSSQQSDNIRRVRLQRRSMERIPNAARPESKNRSLPKNYYQSRTNTGMSSISEDQVSHVDIKQKGISAASLERLTYSANEEQLLKYSRSEIARALLSLRNMNDKLKHTKNSEKKLPIPSPPCVEEQEAALAQVRGELALVQKELEQEKMKAAESEKQRKRAIKELAQMSMMHANPFDDQHFKEQVELLQHKIDHWVRNQDWTIVKEGFFSARTAPKEFIFLHQTSPYYPEYITSPRGLERLVEAYIWQFAVQKIFGKGVWAMSLIVHKKENHKPIQRRNELSALYFDLQQSIPDRQELVHDWRVAGARALAAREPQTIDQRARDIAIGDLGRELVSKLNDISYTDLDFDNLVNVLGETVDLDFKFAQQKPHYKFYPEADMFLKALDMPFSSASMRVSTDDSTKIIPAAQQPLKLILRPGLLKYGNSAGRKYHQYALISNMTVEVMAVGQSRSERGLDRVNSRREINDGLQAATHWSELPPGYFNRED